jgi:hypothetical protein
MLALLPSLQILATLSAALFAGGAFYINFVEHPARLSLETDTALRHWRASFWRATFLQGSLALLSLASGAAVWWFGGGGVPWLVAALLIGAIVSYTLVVILPVNHRLLDRNRDTSSEETCALLERWGRLQTVRTLLSLASTLLYLWLLRTT